MPLTAALIDKAPNRGQIRPLDNERVEGIRDAMRSTLSSMDIQSCLFWQADVLGGSRPHAHPRVLVPPIPL